MEGEHDQDWDPTSEQAQRDQRAAYDAMRKRCPVAHSEFFGWTLFRYEDVMRALRDHETFSNAVSQHLTVPNGMDPPEHTEYRKIIEPYFSAQRMAVFEPKCRAIAKELVKGLAGRGEVEMMATVTLPFAVQIQCAFLGWPPALHDKLIDWISRNQQATLAQDRKALSEIAIEFEQIIDELLELRRSSKAPPEQDVTASLMHENVWGRPLTNEEVTSILRNWTAGEIGTISAAVGIAVSYLADHSELQTQLRAEPKLLSYAIDEILRMHGPLVANRRVMTKAVEIGGRKIAAGERISLNWISANRDESVFVDAAEFRWDRDISKNLLYGAGIHVCPGAPLASLEIRVFMEEFLSATKKFISGKKSQPEHARYPASGFTKIVVRF
jgi:cytochrome P450